MRNALLLLFASALLLSGFDDVPCLAQLRFRYRLQQQTQPQQYYRPSARANSGYRPQYRPQYRYPVNVPNRTSAAGVANPAGRNSSTTKPAAQPSSSIKYLKPELPPVKPFPRIAADFEEQRAVLISVCELLPNHEQVFLQIVEACRDHIQVGILVNDKKQLIEAVRLLDKQKREYPHIKFYHVDLDTIWLRDFGPRIAEMESGSVAFDFLYEGTRPQDERMPKAWADLTGQRYHSVPWTMQGGNLLFNGQGLALTTQRIFDDNHVRFKNPIPGTDPEVERREMVINEFRKECNLRQIVVLEPLRNEATRHVDMFAAFVAEDHVLVAQIPRSGDPVNAALLDRNAALLEKVKLANGKSLRVTRIPTPPRNDKYWSTFTNVIFANDLVILPSFKSDQAAYVERAVAIYKSVLPEHEVVVVDTSSMKKLEGSVHCMSINVPSFSKLPPRYLSLGKAKEYVKNIDRSKQAAVNAKKEAE